MRTSIDTDRLGDEIAELAAHLDAATHRLLTLIRRFDEAGGWADQGALSCAHWLSWRIGLELGAAREHVRVARALAGLSLVDDALRRGEVSYSKVRALTRVATPGTEGALLEMARSSTASQLERVCRSYRRALRAATGKRPGDDAEHRWVRERETEAGLVRFEVQLRPDEAAVVRRALEAAMQRVWETTDVSAGTPPASLRRADALVAVAEQYLAGGTTTGAPPVEVVVHVDATGLAEPDGASGTLDDGTALGPASTGRLLCDATVVEDSRETSSTSGAGGAPFRRCSAARSACAIAGAAFRAARTGRSTAITSSRGRAAGPRRSRTCARSAGGITPTSTSTASASRPTARAGSGSSGRTGPRSRRSPPHRRCRPIRWTPCECSIGRRGSRSTRGRGFRAGTGGRRTTITPSSA